MFSFEGDWSSGKFLVDTNFPAFKETNRENTPSNKTQESGYLSNWYIKQLFVRGSYTQIKISKK